MEFLDERATVRIRGVVMLGYGTDGRMLDSLGPLMTHDLMTSIWTTEMLGVNVNVGDVLREVLEMTSSKC